MNVMSQAARTDSIIVRSSPIPHRLEYERREEREEPRKGEKMIAATKCMPSPSRLHFKFRVYTLKPVVDPLRGRG